MTMEEIMFLNKVSEQIQEMDNPEDIINRLEEMKKEYTEKF